MAAVITVCCADLHFGVTKGQQLRGKDMQKTHIKNDEGRVENPHRGLSSTTTSSERSVPLSVLQLPTLHPLWNHRHVQVGVSRSCRPSRRLCDQRLSCQGKPVRQPIIFDLSSNFSQPDHLDLQKRADPVPSPTGPIPFQPPASSPTPGDEDDDCEGDDEDDYDNGDDVNRVDEAVYSPVPDTPTPGPTSTPSPTPTPNPTSTPDTPEPSPTPDVSTSSETHTGGQ